MQLPNLDNMLLRLGAATRQKCAEEATVTAADVRKILEDADSSAVGCFLAIREALGEGCRAWEPESLWLTLDRRKINVPALNRDKILAAHTITMIPAFWWEVNCFQNTVMAFNNVLSNPGALQEATPGQLAWGVFEAEMIYTYADFDETPEFDREPALYTGACLHRAGYILAPDLLHFAQDALDGFNKGKTSSLEVSEVRRAWKQLNGKTLKQDWKDDDPLDVQLSRLASVSLYIEDRAQRYKDDVSRLL
jgi:hypothetical protein